jgi:hypothetical protein
MKAELTVLDTASAETEWLCELLSDLPVVEKPIPAILMNYDIQIVITKVNSAKDNMKSLRHVKRCLKSVKKLKKLGSNNCGLYTNRQKPGRSLYKRDITEYDRNHIKGDGYETHMSLQQ